MDEKSTMKFAVIGTGWIFSTQKFIFKLVKRAEIVALVDRNEKLVKKHAKGMNIPWFTDSKDLYCSDIEFDAVYIATPHFTHFSLMKEAIEHHKHVFCDKPITISAKEGVEIIAFAKEHDVKIGVNYQYRYDKNAYRLVKACQDGVLGKILYATVSVPWYRDIKYYEQGTWRKRWDTSGGGTVITHASHAIDILLWALGAPKNVLGKFTTALHTDIGVETEDIGMAILEFQNNILAQILSTSCTKPKRTVVRIEVFGENGAIKYRGPGPLSTLKWKGIKKKRYKLNVKGFIGFDKIINAFIDCVWHNKELYSTAESALLTLKTVLAIYDSGRKGKNVELI